MNNKNEIKEGAYPQMSMAQEFGSAIFTAAMIFLPYIFDRIRMKLTDRQLNDFAKQVVKDVENDGGRDSLKSKISRAANNAIQKMTGGRISSVQQEVLNILPDNIEKKSEKEVSAETTSKLDTVRKHDPVRNFRG
jgi:hypothetical protein